MQDNLLFHCSLTAQHVLSDIISHYQEFLNCNNSFLFYSRLSLPAAVMVEWELAEPLPRFELRLVQPAVWSLYHVHNLGS